MITEDYVSYETAKLLKEKGFDEETIKCFSVNGELLDIFDNTYGRVEPANWNGMSEKGYGLIGLLDWYGSISAPTLAIAMKWMREEYHIMMDVYYDSNYNRWISEYYDDNLKVHVWVTSSDIYEEACEAAIKYCLENLI